VKLYLHTPNTPSGRGVELKAGTNNILAKLIKAGGGTLRTEIHKLICSIWNKEELPQQWKESIIVPI
jgi:hypothetical protein